MKLLYTVKREDGLWFVVNRETGDKITFWESRDKARDHARELNNPTSVAVTLAGLNAA